MSILKTLLYISSMFLMCAQMGAQVSEGGEPISLSDPDLNVGVPLINLTMPDVTALLQEDAVRDAAGLLLRDAVVVPVNTDLGSNGIWFDLDNGGRLWRLDVRAAGALSLEVFFDIYNLPVGGKVFIISENGEQYVGGYTEENNRSSGRISMEMVKGNLIRLELYEPPTAIGESELSILDIGYRYRDIIGFNNPLASGLTDCQVPIGCEEGAGWEEVSKSVVRVRSRVNGNLFWASGTVVNNSSLDCRPLVLTSLSASLYEGFQSSVVDFSFFRFYFSDTSTDCEVQLDFDLSISGSESLGDSNDDGGASGSDFLLLELARPVPETYPVYFAGWTSSETGPESAVAIHHPFGAGRMIATESDAPTVSGWGTFDTHWRSTWSSTSNGRGYMDLGSTGAPLFDDQYRLIGTYTGGNGECDGDVQPDFFGRFSEHWGSNPNPPGEKLKILLDPQDISNGELEGDSVPCAIVDDLTERIQLQVNVYPNPARDVLRFELPLTTYPLVSIQLYDSQGVKKRMWKDLKDRKVSLLNLNPGVYHLVFEFEYGRYSSERLVILD